MKQQSLKLVKRNLQEYFANMVFAKKRQKSSKSPASANRTNRPASALK
jgi:hypothetical protein